MFASFVEVIVIVISGGCCPNQPNISNSMQPVYSMVKSATQCTARCADSNARSSFQMGGRVFANMQACLSAYLRLPGVALAVEALVVVEHVTQLGLVNLQ